MLEEMGWPQREPTQIVTDNSTYLSIDNDTTK